MNQSLTRSSTVSERPLLLFGAAHLDRVARADAPFLPHASNLGHLTEGIGGAAYNAASALVRFGRSPHLVTARGGDAAGASVEAAVRARGIADHAMTWLDRATPTYTAILDHEGELVAGVADMALYDLLMPRVLARRHLRMLVEAAGAILVDANLPPATLARIAEAGPCPVAAIGVSPGKVVRLAACLSHLDLLFVSRAEALALSACPPTAGGEEVAARLLALGIRRAVVTDGHRSAMLIDDGRLSWQQPPPVERVRDVTGAGDTLAAVTLAEWQAGRPFPEAVRTGMAAASLHIAAGLPQDCAAVCRDLGAALPVSHTLEFEETRP